MSAWLSCFQVYHPGGGGQQASDPVDVLGAQAEQDLDADVSDVEDQDASDDDSEAAAPEPRQRIRQRRYWKLALQHAYIAVRKRCAVLRITPNTKADCSSEWFAYRVLMLNIPWRLESELLPIKDDGSSPTAVERLPEVLDRLPPSVRQSIEQQLVLESVMHDVPPVSVATPSSLTGNRRNPGRSQSDHASGPRFSMPTGASAGPQSVISGVAALAPMVALSDSISVHQEARRTRLCAFSRRV